MIDPALQRKAFVTGLIDVIGQGIDQNRLDDAEAVLGCLRILRPNTVELDTFEAWISIKRGRWSDAVRTLRNIDAANGDWQLGKALLAFCQFAMGDSEWTICANEVMENGKSPEAVGLIKLLMYQGNDKLDEAAPSQAAATETGTLFPMNDPNFLRV